ncbi:MAG: hypothetical protein NZ922_02075 [Candidatus Methanomethyliaceae archaeon]|nr:hypothetical protein [Candidatus Methanomethyliaceae archaeon]MDW7970741.1 hypothetical protein [Nitrososphaerota archaeon]
MKPTIEDRILLLLAIKEKGKYIDLEHILEKVSRDENRKIDYSEILNELNSMANRGLININKNGYSISERGYNEILNKLPIIGDGLNLSYRMVLLAKQYYPKVADYILPFLKERPISVVKIFSDEEDPIGRIKPLFVRYAKYKPKPIFISINSVEELMRYVNDHAIDYIPYIHGFDMKAPDWLVIDLDAGEGLKSEEGFLAVKFVTKEVYNFLMEYDVIPAIKFSGSRGMQIWASLDNSKIHGLDKFAAYRALIQRIQVKIEERLKGSSAPSKLKPFIEKGLTTSTVAKKEERAYKILLDWSSMKPYGDVRAPFSLHYRTGLVSCPIDPNRIMEFQIVEADSYNVIKNRERLSKFFELNKSDPSKLLRVCNI